MTTSPITSINDELLAELEQLADKATPGPWWIDSHGHRMVSEASDHGTVFMADDRMGKAERNKATGNLSHWPNDWDASYIATANPATIKALLAHIVALKSLLRDARETLTYADYQTGVCYCGDPVDAHGFGDGHAPVDAGAYHVAGVIERIDAAMQEAKP